MNEIQPERNEGAREIILRGIAAAPGVAVGPVWLMTTEDDRPVERDITGEEIPREIARFEEAIIETRRQIHEIKQRLDEALAGEKASVFDAHLLMVDDRALVEEVIHGLHLHHKNVETVLRRVGERYVNALLGARDDYLRERAADVRDVTRRILRNLAGERRSALETLREPCVLVANDLAPSDTASLPRGRVLAFSTDMGSATSHTAIMARALEIPAAVGLHDASVRVSAGDLALVDGNEGVLILHPSPETLEQYGRAEAKRQVIRSGLSALRESVAETRDGYCVQLSANIELPADVDAVLAHGAYGVGLFRTEYLYLSRRTLPSEAEQFEAYESVARRLHPAPAIIRTLDLGGDKFVSHLETPPEVNPFMGWRAIRFCLAQPAIFKTQLRAILRASRYDNVRMMYPMISNVDEVLRAHTLVEECKAELRREGQPFNEQLEIGAMIEVPSAALSAHILAPHLKFFSLGTNDLVQYTLAVDRVNERIAHLYEPTHPAILRLIHDTVNTGHGHGIWTGVCGEMAGNPLLTPLLLGLGVDELSVNPAAVPLVKDVIRKLRFAEVEGLATRALASGSATAVLQSCRAFVAAHAPEILELVG